MTDWENDYAASFIYQDLADCSLGAFPVITELEKTSEAKKIDKVENTALKVNVLKKVSIFLFLFMTWIVTI